MGLLIVYIFFLCVVLGVSSSNFRFLIILFRNKKVFFYYFSLIIYLLLVLCLIFRKLTVERWVQGIHHINNIHVFTPNKLLHIANQFTKLDIQLNSVKNNKTPNNNNNTTNTKTTQRIQKSKYKNWKEKKITSIFATINCAVNEKKRIGGILVKCYNNQNPIMIRILIFCTFRVNSSPKNKNITSDVLKTTTTFNHWKKKQRTFSRLRILYDFFFFIIFRWYKERKAKEREKKKEKEEVEDGCCCCLGISLYIFIYFWYVSSGKKCYLVKGKLNIQSIYIIYIFI